MSLWGVLLVLTAPTIALAAATQDCHATAFIGTAYRDRLGTDYSVKAEIAAFADGYASPATGELVRAGDGFADMGCLLPWKRPETGPWIALVRRGGCSIEMKIANAVDQGANGLIIYNNRDSLSLQNLRVTPKYQTLISVVFTHKWKGDELTTLLDYGARIAAELSIANPCVAINNNHERNMQLVSISFLCFIVLTISLAWVIFFYVQRHRVILARERKARGYSDADEKALKAIPTKTIKANDKLLKDEFECCAICIDPYRQSEVVRVLVCSHEFHKDCVDPWLLENRTCPMCKKDILRHYGSAFLGSQESIIQMGDDAHRQGPSSPAIQVIVVANRRTPTPSPMPSPMRSMASSVPSDMEILTERVQPTNRDAVCFAESCSSLLTVDSAQEALHLVESHQEWNYQGTSKSPLEAFIPTPGTSKSSSEALIPVKDTSKSSSEAIIPAPGTSEALIPAPRTSESSLEALIPATSESPFESLTPAPGTSESSSEAPTSAPGQTSLEQPSDISPAPSLNAQDSSHNPLHSVDSCQELREIESETMCVDENDNPVETSDETASADAEHNELSKEASAIETSESENS